MMNVKKNKDIMDACLKYYIKQCYEIYSIAFLQWIRKFPSKIMEASNEDVDKTIQTKLNQLNKNYNPNQKVNNITAREAKLRPDFNHRFDILDNDLHCFNINSFAQIGMSDPFPNDKSQFSKTDIDKFKLPTTTDQMIYDESRYIEGLAPYCIYIPRKELMFKMMKACIGVQKVEDLWFHRKVMPVKEV